MKDKLQTLNQLGNMNIIGKIDFIYKWHNGLALTEQLKTLTGDDTFEFLHNEFEEGYLFKNNKGETVLLNDLGEFVVSDIGYNPIFTKICQQRISKTEKMVNLLSFTKSDFAF